MALRPGGAAPQVHAGALAGCSGGPAVMPDHAKAQSNGMQPPRASTVVPPSSVAGAASRTLPCACIGTHLLHLGADTALPISPMPAMQRT